MLKKICVLLLLLHVNLFMAEDTTKDHSITIFIHGTYPVRSFIEYSPFRFLAYTKQGLHLAKDLPKNYHFYKLAQGCVEHDSDRFSLDQFYIYGWTSEHVYHKVRNKAAQDLVKSLKNKVESYFQNYGVIPKIRLIGFSHGGNVVLNTANFLPIVCNEKKVEIEAWLFGTPVQNMNCHLVNSSCFSRVYSIFSRTDWIQRMDPQGFRNLTLLKQNMFWSDRTFNFDNNATQVEFTVNGKPIGHVYYRSILKYFPKIEKMVKEKSTAQPNELLTVDLQI